LREPHVSRHKAVAALILGACAIALAPIFVRFSDVGSTATGFYRMFFAALVLWPWLLAEGRTSRPSQRLSSSQWLLIIVAGVCFAADVVFFHAASRITTVANATLLLNFAPIFVIVGAWLLFGESPPPALVVGLGIALTGAALLMSHSLSLSATHLRGDGFGVTAAIFYAGYLLAVSRLRASLSTAQIMLWTSAIGALSLLPVALLDNEPFLASSPWGWIVLLALGILSHAGGQGLIAFALAHLQVGFSGVALLVQPVAAAMFAWALLGEALGPIQVVGGLIVIAGVLVARRATERNAGQLGMPKSR
jgi:drug/metabolite transporter (DMT)-like permease